MMITRRAARRAHTSAASTRTRAPSYMMERFSVDGFPETKLVLALFKNVKNATELKSKYLNRVALLDAGTHLQALAAAPTVHIGWHILYITCTQSIPYIFRSYCSKSITETHSCSVPQLNLQQTEITPTEGHGLVVV